MGIMTELWYILLQGKKVNLRKISEKNEEM